MFDGESRGDNVEDEKRPLLQQEGRQRVRGYVGHYDDQPGNSQSSRQDVQGVVDMVVGGEEEESYQNTETHSIVYGSANGDDEGNDSTFPPRSGKEEGINKRKAPEVVGLSENHFLTLCVKINSFNDEVF